MTLKTLASAATLLLTLSPLSIASAQSTTENVFLFETVDSYELKNAYWLKLTGIVRGEATPRIVEVRASVSDTYNQYLRACERMMLMAMSKPGQYYFELQLANYTNPPVTGCKLVRR
ncbi:hypothetical protein ATI61_12533 [Archangium gephyra]|uniref:Secreted protein n=1 Tax=Archangium gephyra TaxID=48 RepID=A0AAC8QIX4_9BACT|nr:hypothetical protein [Archangium gephyra]AKJ08305.1 Hypothetical protein AA314_09931 [Archangium gephyra]REG15407.1 hypothetical protein ATI61_12533 [Archangium gephyra]